MEVLDFLSITVFCEFRPRNTAMLKLAAKLKAFILILQRLCDVSAFSSRAWFFDVERFLAINQCLLRASVRVERL